MSGKEMVQAGRTDEININGTCNVLDACHEHGVRRLVYVSTYNVVFGGKPIVNGSETLPYFPIEDHVDAYGRSKSIAEQLVLKSNGRQAKSNKGTRLYTCAIRPAAIYGPASFRIGAPNVKTDWVYADNLVLALILASMGLLDDIPGRKGTPVAAGQAYFICDALFTFNIPTTLNKELVGVTHYFSYLKAKEELGYVPVTSPQEGLAATISYWQERKRRELDGPTIFTWVAVIIGMLAVFSAAFLPPVGPLKWVLAVHLFVFRSVLAIRIVFVAAVAAHAGEGVYAWFLAKKVDPRNATGWFWQTFALGFFSLRFLLKRARAGAGA
ncbi:unnamed protein product [Triticum turgidum subsp. durum]|uniref:3-beta hydroxysteroid dehydrogenase/isomerase domain-containing protein n=1 Tax=Triticum turgidum subsp. durum TaxID=4567 RepID=A0A9R0Y5E3_TRITD|nr:unnamed protein product [Triticum turgidum subsp. durum]